MIKGVLVFHSETGTEGGYWAMQDEQFMGIKDRTQRCSACGLHWPEGQETEPVWRGKSKVCEPGTHTWEAAYPNGIWSYEGLHILRDGDHLRILHPDDRRLVWEGDIQLNKHPLFTEDASGLWIHADQVGVDREDWAQPFFQGWPCELEPNKEKP